MWTYIKDFFIPLPGLAVAIFSIYFAIKRIGNSVSVSYSVDTSEGAVNRINNLLLVNKKHKPINVFAVIAILEKHYAIEIVTFDVPLILNGQESKQIKTDLIKKYTVGPDQIEPDFLAFDAVDIYVLTESKKVKCKFIPHPGFGSIFKFNEYELVRKNIIK